MSLNTTFSAGQVLTAAHLNGLQAAWETTWTPTWTAATVNPAIGNGTLRGRYLRIGKTIFFRIDLSAGSTTTFGTGNWRFTLPVAPASSWRHKFFGDAYDNGTADYNAWGRWLSSGSYLEMMCDPTTAGTGDRSITSTVPFAWGNGDELCIAGVYEAA